MTQQASISPINRRARFLRREMFKALREAAFNRRHYSDAEALCWDAAAADALLALGGMAASWAVA